MKSLTLLLVALSVSQLCLAVGTDSIQMQMLIEASQQQLKIAQEQLKQAKQDAKSIDRAAGTLDQLAKGLDQKIQSLQGTKVYDQAILKIQERGALRVGAEALPNETDAQAESRKNFNQFQQQSHRANQEDMVTHDQISKALNEAAPGFVPKLQAQTQLAQWQSNVRISSQLTELLAAIQGLRQDMRGSNQIGEPRGFDVLLSGLEKQREKLQGVKRVP